MVRFDVWGVGDASGDIVSSIAPTRTIDVEHTVLRMLGDPL